MAFPTLPSNGDTYTKDATIYTYDSASNSWSITGYEGVPASIYISSEDLDFSFSSTSGYSETEISTTYCVNIGSYIYCPVILYSNDFKFCVLYFTTDSTAFPVRVSTTYTGTISGYNIISQYVDGGVIYLNDSSGKYHTFDTSDNSFTTNNTGS